jgi:hypothetical protein
VVDRIYKIPGTASVIVTSQDGKIEGRYTIDFAFGAPSTEARLSSLGVSGATLTPSFSPDVYTYTAKATSSAVPTVNGRQKDDNATLAITQSTTIPGTASVLVIAQDGTTQKLYTVNITA